MAPWRLKSASTVVGPKETNSENNCDCLILDLNGDHWSNLTSQHSVARHRTFGSVTEKYNNFRKVRFLRRCFRSSRSAYHQMRNKKKEHNLWFIILVACAVSKSTAKYENSIDSLLSKLYLFEELPEKRIVDRSNEVNKHQLSNESMSKRYHASQIFMSDRVMGSLSEYLAKAVLNKPRLLGSAKDLESLPRPPILFCLAPLNNGNTPLNLSKVAINNARLINAIGNAKDFNYTLYGGPPKKYSTMKNSRLEKNPSLMESIFNPFFLKVFKSNDGASGKKHANVSTVNNSSSGFISGNDCIISNLVKNTLVERTSVKYNSLVKDLLLVNKLHSHAENLESPYYRFKPGSARRFNTLNKSLEDGRLADNKTRENTIPRNKENQIISKAVKLVDMVKCDDSMGSLLNQTLLDFGSQIFSILQDESKADDSSDNETTNNFWNQIKKKVVGTHRSNHNNIAYELIRNSNYSNPR